MLTGTALMTTTMYAFKEVNDKLLEKGIKIPFACGGGAVNQDFVSQYDLGVYGEEAADAPKIADAIIASGDDIAAIKRGIPQALRREQNGKKIHFNGLR